MVRSLDPDDTPRELTTCAQRQCSHSCDSTNTVMILDSGKLSRVSLEGKVTALADGVKGYAVGGASRGSPPIHVHQAKRTPCRHETARPNAR